eukprot:256517-Chlamydomonas_euryale.AAC.4
MYNDREAAFLGMQPCCVEHKMRRQRQNKACSISWAPGPHSYPCLASLPLLRCPYIALAHCPSPIRKCP